jgi:protein-L-isoaspartate(D-aspartate) O-methyltransferase
MTNEIRVMIDKIREMGVSDRLVIEAMAETDRRDFVAEKDKNEAYADKPLPIGYGQTISQPFTVARMCELIIQGKTTAKKVLEIGTGSGWVTGILARLYQEVYTVEIISELSEKAKDIFRKLKIPNIKCKVGNGKDGWKEYAPYDALIISANAREMPEKLTNQLSEGGAVVIPINGNMMRGIKVSGIMRWKSYGKYNFVPLV